MARMSKMVGIETRYHGPGNVRGSRISARTFSGNRIVRGYDHALNADENHATAAQALADKMGWAGELVGGSCSRAAGYVFVFVA